MQGLEVCLWFLQKIVSGRVARSAGWTLCWAGKGRGPGGMHACTPALGLPRLHAVHTVDCVTGVTLLAPRSASGGRDTPPGHAHAQDGNVILARTRTRAIDTSLSSLFAEVRLDDKSA